MPKPGNTSVCGWIVSGLVVFSIAQNLYFNFRAGAHARSVIASASGNAPSLAANFLQIDQLFATAPAKGNVCLTFRGFGTTELVSLEMPYYRSVYALYPRKVLAAPAGTLINGGTDVLRAAFAPSPDWLDQNNISFVTEFTKDGAGGVSFNQFTVNHENSPRK